MKIQLIKKDTNYIIKLIKININLFNKTKDINYY
jgi:hypothetical protein